MKTLLNSPRKLAISALAIAYIMALPAQAQFTKLLDFDGTNGKYPAGSLTTDGTYLYGMTTTGNNIFRIKPDGSGDTTLYHLTFPDGSSPGGALFFDGTWLYGTAQYSGGGYGTVFRVKPDGSGFAVIHSFGNSGGAYPMGSLISDGTYLYGMTDGGNGSLGSVFKLMPDGSNYSALHVFTTSNFDGSRPRGSLVTDGTWLYGMTEHGGYSDLGTVFKINTDGTGYAKLFDFYSGATGPGASPFGDLIFDGTWLYGMTKTGGPAGHGTIFKIHTDGSNCTNVHNFGIYSDGLGSEPYGSLLSDGTWFYGMTYAGNNIFKIKPDGTGFTVMYNLSNADGAGLNGSLISDGNFLYGMALYGGVNNDGTVFKLDMNSVAGIDQAAGAEETLIAYPNPAYAVLTLEWNIAAGKPREYSITDMLGNTVLHVDTNDGAAPCTIDIHALESGIYFLKAGSSVWKFVKN